MLILGAKAWKKLNLPNLTFANVLFSKVFVELVRFVIRILIKKSGGRMLIIDCAKRTYGNERFRKSN